MDNKKVFSMRINSELFKKIRYIAASNGRSTNRELEYRIRRYVETFEKTYGKIKAEDMEEF